MSGLFSFLVLPSCWQSTSSSSFLRKTEWEANFDIPPSLCVCMYVYMHFLTFQHYKILYAHLVYFLSQSYNQRFLQGALVPFVGETKIWALVCLLPLRRLAFRPFQLMAQEIWFMLISINISNKKLLQMCNHLCPY